VRRRAEHEAQIAHAAGRQLRVRQHTAAQRAVDALLCLSTSASWPATRATP